MSYLTGQVICRPHNKLQELSVYKTQLVFMNNYFPFISLFLSFTVVYAYRLFNCFDIIVMC